MYDKNDELIKLENIDKIYRSFDGFFKSSGTEFKAVNGACLSIMKGRSLGIVGESGSGKTTLSKIICDIIKPDSGTVFYKGKELNTLSSDEKTKFRKEIQMVFQDPYSSLNPKLTIFSSMCDAIIKHMKLSKKEAKVYCASIMQTVGLTEEHLDRFPHEFSGGQRQRISIARALSLKPEIIIADEPVSSLDVSVQAQILNLLYDLKTNEGISLILVSHDLAVVSFLCDDVAVMKDGKIVEYGNTDYILKNSKNEYTLSLINSSL